MSALLALLAGIAACSGMSETLIAAHRGGTTHGAPENTLPAFTHAVQQGAQLIELDLRATADGTVVVHHDRSTARTLGIQRLIHRTSLAELRGLAAEGAMFIPTLNDVIDWAGPRSVGLLLDVKPAPGLTPSAIIEPLRSAGLSQRILLGVRSAEQIGEFRQHDSELKFLGLVPGRDAIDEFIAAGAQAVRLWPRWLREQPGLVMRLRERAVGTWVTTGRAGADELAGLADLGIEGVITDRPATALRAMGCPQPDAAAEES